jgi:hypothetical protein
MRPDNSRYLIQAARDRSQAALTRARSALKDIGCDGQPVTFRAVAAAAGVSRAWLYRQPALRAEIERLRADAPASSHPVPAGQRASDQSRQQRIEALLADNARLRADNARLRDHVATLLGERRVAQVTAPAAVPAQANATVSDMSQT